MRGVAVIPNVKTCATALGTSIVGWAERDIEHTSQTSGRNVSVGPSHHLELPYCFQRYRYKRVGLRHVGRHNSMCKLDVFKDH